MQLSTVSWVFKVWTHETVMQLFWREKGNLHMTRKASEKLLWGGYKRLHLTGRIQWLRRKETMLKTRLETKTYVHFGMFSMLQLLNLLQLNRYYFLTDPCIFVFLENAIKINWLILNLKIFTYVSYSNSKMIKHSLIWWVSL